jgi:ribosomal protein L29
MSRYAHKVPTKDDLRKMTVSQLNSYLRGLRQELTWRPKTSYAYKSVTKQIAVAEKLRELQQGREAAGDA